MNVKTVNALVALLLCFSFLEGCGGTPHVTAPNAKIEVREAEKIHLRVGLVISHDFQNKTYHTGYNSDPIQLGQASTEIFKKYLPLLFQKVAFLSPGADTSQYQLLAYPAFEKVFAGQGGKLCRITFSLTFKEQTGYEIFKVIGKGSNVGSEKDKADLKTKPGEDLVNFGIGTMMLPFELTFGILGAIVAPDAMEKSANESGYVHRFHVAINTAFAELMAHVKSSHELQDYVRWQKKYEQGKAVAEALDEFVVSLLKDMSAHNKKRLAVIEFRPLIGESGEVDRYIVEELTTKMANVDTISVVERVLMARILEELHRNATDLVDPKHAKKFGRLSFADALLVGTLTDLGDIVKLNGRLIDTETGCVFSVASTSFVKDEHMMQLARKKLQREKARQEKKRQKALVQAMRPFAGTWQCRKGKTQWKSISRKEAMRQNYEVYGTKARKFKLLTVAAKYKITLDLSEDGEGTGYVTYRNGIRNHNLTWSVNGDNAKIVIYEMDKRHFEGWSLKARSIKNTVIMVGGYYSLESALYSKGPFITRLVLSLSQNKKELSGKANGPGILYHKSRNLGYFIDSVKGIAVTDCLYRKVS